MKKKFKLLTSIASLGLALALMTFGVLAATQVTLTTKSEVSFTTAPSVYVDATWSVSGCVETVEAKTYSTEALKVDADSATLDLGAVTFDETHREIVYTLQIDKQANAEHNFNVNLTDNSDAIPGEVKVTRVVSGDGVSVNNVASYTYTITYTLTDARISVTTLKVSLEVVLTPYSA